MDEANWVLGDEAATQALGERLAAFLLDGPPSQRLMATLSGPLGAGKSTLARAILRALGVRGTIRSPTYTLVEPYELTHGQQLRHLDLYRLGDPEELEFLGFFDDLRDSWLTLVEWPERVPAVLELADLRLQLRHGTGAHERRVLAQARSAQGREWLRSLE